jgi:hypothetical protein
MTALGDAIAGAALLLSLYATWRSHRVATRQERVLDLEQQVHQLTLEKSARDEAAAGQADVSCTIVRLGSSKYRLKVFNRGRAAASNVRVELPDGDLVPESMIHSKFPMRTLEPGQSVELAAHVHMQTKPKHLVRLYWDDPSGATKNKELDVTL